MRKPASSAGERRTFRYPLDPCPKVAVICDTLQVPVGCRRVSEREPVDLRILRAETIAAPASWVAAWDADGWSPTFPIVVFTGNRYGFLDDEDRDTIWRRFGVPVFEQVLDDEGRIFASECEAHVGLHIDPGVHHTISEGELLLNGRPTGIHVREITGVCGCGRSGARVLDAGPALTHAIRYSA